MANTKDSCFRRCRWNKSGTGRNSWKRPAAKPGCAPLAGRTPIPTSSRLRRWYSASTNPRCLCPKRGRLKLSPSGKQHGQQIYRRTEPRSAPEPKYRNEITAQEQCAHAATQQVDSIERASFGPAAAVRKINLGCGWELIPPQYSRERSQCWKNELRRQPSCWRTRDFSEQANHKHQHRRRERQQELGGCHGAVRWVIPDESAADTQPTSEGNACHAQANEDRELVVYVTIDGLECQQQQNLQTH